MTSALRNTILSQFEPDVARELLAFAQSLSRIKADFVMFMARKSLCLYDVLHRAGVPPIESCVISDRVLDMNLAPFRGKRVALVDDTLIVGTSLAKAKRLLETAGALVTTHVFCVDTEWYCKELIVPDSIALKLSDDRVMTFCTGEVRALSILPRPYLVDFPHMRPFHLQPDQMDGLLADTCWRTMKLSTRLQEEHGVAALSSFPSPEHMANLERLLQKDLISCIDIIKVRLWAKRVRSSWVVQAIPLVTLAPLSVVTLQRLTTHLLRQLLQDPASIAGVQEHVNTPKSQQRLCQFILSASIGADFMSSLSQRIPNGLKWRYDANECERHYGPWLADLIDRLSTLSNVTALANCPSRRGPDRFVAAEVPQSVRDWTDTSIRSPIDRPTYASRQRREHPASILSEFAGLFLNIYDNRELRAREEARELGRAYLDPETRTPNRDRLEKGVPWTLLVESMAGPCQVANSPAVVNCFSLLLDLCNDVGIAVPVTCIEGTTVYRGYRHGEDVKFSDGELALAYDTAEAFLKRTGRTTIPRLVLEKLLVLLIKVGASRRFLDVLYGATGTDGVCRIGFDLKGARPLYSRGPAQSADRDLWLTDYLLARKTIKDAPKRGKLTQGYILGKRPQGNYFVHHAPDEAKDLGTIVGMLSAKGERGMPILDEKAITILASCETPLHVARALQVELSIFDHWYQDRGRHLLEETELSDPRLVARSLKALLNSRGHEAIHSALLKYVGHSQGQCSAIVKSAARRLSLTDDIFVRKWMSYWPGLRDAELVDQRNTFQPLIDRFALLLWDVAVCMSAVEISLRYRQTEMRTGGTDKGLLAAFAKLAAFRSGMRAGGLTEPRLAARVAERFERLSALEQTAFRFAQDNEILLGLGPRDSGESAPFRAEEAIRYARHELARLHGDILDVVDVAEPVIEHYGKRVDRVDYSHILYYDIVDSTATYAARQHRDVEEYRQRVHKLKDVVNHWFDRAIGEAQDAGDAIMCVNGSKNSSNDCKHVFMRGINAKRWLSRAIAGLVGSSEALGLSLRIYAAPCDFAGTGAYRYGADPEVQGERFWEHWSRVCKECRTLEPPQPVTSSFLLVLTTELAKSLVLESPLVWEGLNEAVIKSEIEFLFRETHVRYGSLRVLSSAGR